VSKSLQDDIAMRLRSRGTISVAWLFGSIADGTEGADSDLDIAVLGPEPLSAAEKQQIIEDLARQIGRPVDLIDLQSTHGPIVGTVLQNGIRLFCTDTTLLAERITTWWANQADWMPYRRRIRATRRQQWIEN
jgi:predicted nucleotidyltransferase